MSEQKDSRWMTVRFAVMNEVTFSTERALVEKELSALQGLTEEQIARMSPKGKALRAVVLEGFEKQGVEGAFIELARLAVRQGFNEVTQQELAAADDKTSLKVSPSKVVVL